MTLGIDPRYESENFLRVLVFCMSSQTLECVEIMADGEFGIRGAYAKMV